MANDNFQRNLDFMGLRAYDVFRKATEDYHGKLQAIDYSMEVDYDSYLGIEGKCAQFRVVFTCDGELYEAFPSFDWPTDHAPISPEAMAYHDQIANDLKKSLTTDGNKETDRHH